MKVKLTEQLKQQGAILVIGDKDLPTNYIGIAGALVDGQDVVVAVPMATKDNRKLINDLARQAYLLLIGAM